MAGTFEPYGASHAVAAAIGAVGAVGVVLLGRRILGRPLEERVRRGFALLIPVFTVPLQVRQWLPGEFDLGTSLPLQICDLSWLVAMHALWTRSRRTSALLYYWGLTLTVQAVVTPTLGKDFPDPEYVMFWGMHLLTIWAALFMVVGLDVRPDWPGYRFTVLCTMVWLAVVMTFNAVAGTNYGYLARKPDVSSLLDVFGPWPLYVVVEAAVLLAGWALITWPWVRWPAPIEVRTGRRPGRP
ncbi:TIGR02206 family membrane protein [Nocardioides panacihumi]|uniref:TIGR02206 family membrane protein n=1 Tax=Nocardioides panacihumi TaxID=400774 RepID=A0ABN2R8E8_9ACTN